MKLNYNKIFYLILHSLAIGLLIILSSLLLLTNYVVYTYLSFFATYALGILLVRKNHKYPLWKKRNN